MAKRRVTTPCSKEAGKAKPWRSPAPDSTVRWADGCVNTSEVYVAPAGRSHDTVQ
jgi:hypothetical protein